MFGLFTKSRKKNKDGSKNEKVETKKMSYKKHKRLGTGSYGSVWSIGALYVVKTSKLTEDSDSKDVSPKLLDVYRREVHFLQTLKGCGICPNLKDCYFKSNNTKGVQIMERFDGTVKQLAQSQALKYRHWLPKASLLFYPQQLSKMKELVMNLEKRGICHGDLKISNMLYRVQPQKQISIRIADFGFAGYLDDKTYSPLVGFARRYGIAPQTLEDPANGSFKLVHPLPDSLKPVCNRMHLYLYFQHEKNCFCMLVGEKDSKSSFQSMTDTFLMQWLELTPQHIQDIRLYCTTKK